MRIRNVALMTSLWLFGVATTHAADAVRGKQVFQACAACHSDKPGGALGPTLAGVVGRNAGSREDFRYSPAMTRAGFIWDEAKLREFVMQPQAVVRGTSMSFGGMDDAADVDNLVAYTATLK